MTNRNCFDVPIAALPEVYGAVAKASEGTIVDEQIEARCVACGIRLNGRELKQLAAGELTEKLQRVRLQYCARRTCESRFYRIIVNSPSAAIAAALEGLTIVLPPTATAKATVFSSSLVAKTAVCAVIFGLVLFAGYHWYYGGRIPFAQTRHDYRTAGIWSPGP